MLPRPQALQQAHAPVGAESEHEGLAAGSEEPWEKGLML